MLPGLKYYGHSPIRTHTHSLMYMQRQTMAKRGSVITSSAAIVRFLFQCRSGIGAISAVGSPKNIIEYRR